MTLITATKERQTDGHQSRGRALEVAEGQRVGAAGKTERAAEREGRSGRTLHPGNRWLHPEGKDSL